MNVVAVKSNSAGSQPSPGLRSRDGRVYYKAILVISGIHLIALGSAFYFSWFAAIGFIVLSQFFVTVGMSAGLHRLFSHRCYQPHPLVFNGIALIGTLCLQGSPIYWATIHRQHHARNDEIGDAHSSARGFWWSHIGWLFFTKPNGLSFIHANAQVRDLRKLPFLRWLDRNYLKINFGVMAAGLIIFSALQRLDLFFWWFPLRIVAVWHLTWGVNSYLHNAHHKRNGETSKPIKNTQLFSLLCGGDGYHDEHHKYPWSPRVGVKKHQLDPGWLFIKTLVFFKLAEIPPIIERRIRAINEEHLRANEKHQDNLLHQEVFTADLKKSA